MSKSIPSFSSACPGPLRRLFGCGAGLGGLRGRPNPLEGGHPMKTLTPRSDRGIYLLELMVSVTLMGVMVLGLTTVLITQARQAARDKLLTDLAYYADLVLDEAADSFGGAFSVERNSNAGGRLKEHLEFNFLGKSNLGRNLETTFVREGERKVLIQHNGIRPDWINKFPPPELDPRLDNGTRFRVYVKDFRIRSYQERPFADARIKGLLSEVILVLELEDRELEQRVSRLYRRIISTPNKHITTLREQGTAEEG